jgi:2,3-bisphosphoglycerate-independent phosphoglycerate mutase
MGLASYGGVHSYMTHLYALIKLAHEKGLKKYIYTFFWMEGTYPLKLPLEI